MAAISAGVLAVGSFAVVRSYREGTQRERALREARFDLELAGETISTISGGREANAFLRMLKRRGEFHAVVLLRDRQFSSHDAIGLNDVPDVLRAEVSSDRFSYVHTRLETTPYLVIGGPVPTADAELYLFFSQGPLLRDLATFRNTLIGAWFVVVILAAVVGSLLARRTMQPVAETSKAARSLAEGLLDTRLPVETEDEFGALAASFNEMARALQAKIDELSEARERERRFTSDVAHELRTPLTALVNEASLLRDQLDTVPEGARRPAELLIQDVSRLRELVLDLMEISRLDYGVAAVEKEETDVVEVIGAVLKRNKWQSSVAVEGDHPVVITDPRRLQRIVRNLVANALEHGRRDVRVAVSISKDVLRLKVSDKGLGIPTEHLPHIFNRFYKADVARAGNGTGLGLAIALENAKLLGGAIDVSSRRHGGTTFTLRIPV